jgi:DNA-binding NarL/FixJ family response regulator
MHALDERLVDAWIWCADGASSRGARVATEAAASARAMGQWAAEALALHVELRLGPRQEVTERLGELAAQLDSELVRLWAGHARALQASDAPSLADTGAQLADLGYLLAGAEALAHAAAAFRSIDRRASAAGAAARARDLLVRCESPRTPAITHLDASVALSRREQEVAALASRGLSNREIAERLYVSVRTVESHLANAFTKLGINRRSQLPEALGRESPHLPSS